MGQQLFQHVGGLQLQCTGADARVAGEKGRVIDLAVDEQPDTALRIVGQAQNGGGARVAAQQLPQDLLRKLRREEPICALRSLVWKGLSGGMHSR